MVQTYKNIWVVDFEFLSLPGDTPTPICLTAKNLKTGKIIEEWLEGEAFPHPPYSISKDDLFIAFYASAELGCHLALNWDMPKNILDLYVECRNLFNGDPIRSKSRSLLNVASILGLDGSSVAYKEEMRERILEGAPYTQKEKEDILHYCLSDVIITEKIYKKLINEIDFPRALLRGRYMIAIAMMERNGIPIDMHIYNKLAKNWDKLKTKLIEEANKKYDVYENTVFKANKFEKYLEIHKILWEYTETGRISLSDDTFKKYSKAYPEIEFLRQTRHTLGQLKLRRLTVGKDGRNRTLLSPFSAKTGRNQPSSASFIFGPAKWIRYLIKPKEGYGLAYIDYSQQEIGISAALSQDPHLIEAYNSSDPYLSFGKKVGLLPENATKASHFFEREKFKICFLASQYGMKENTFSKYAGISHNKAHQLLQYHRRIYKRYWEWSDQIVDTASLTGKLQTCYGWKIQTRSQKERSIRNFPMQAAGAEILRLACCLILDANIKICAPVHDAILIESSLNAIKEETEQTQALMMKAGEYVLNGFKLRSEAEIIPYPKRFSDKRGEETWNIVKNHIGGWN